MTHDRAIDWAVFLDILDAIVCGTAVVLFILAGVVVLAWDSIMAVIRKIK